jgi:predicted hydrocarbon binding protein
MENNKSDSSSQNNGVEFNWDTEVQKTSVSEGLKKILTTGISAVLMSEEGVRQYVQELKLPKDALGTLVKGIAKSKEEIVTRVGTEFSKLVEKIDLVDEMTKFLRENKIKISAEIEFSKKEKSKPEKNKVEKS